MHPIAIDGVGLVEVEPVRKGPDPDRARSTFAVRFISPWSSDRAAPDRAGSGTVSQMAVREPKVRDYLWAAFASLVVLLTIANTCLGLYEIGVSFARQHWSRLIFLLLGLQISWLAAYCWLA